MSRTAALLLLCAAFGVAHAAVTVQKDSGSSAALDIIASPIDLEDDALPTYAKPQPLDLPTLPQPEDLLKKHKGQSPPAVSGAPTAVSGAPVKEDKKGKKDKKGVKGAVEDFVDHKKDQVGSLFDKKDDDSKTAVSGAPVKTQVSGAPTKKLEVPVYTMDLKQLGRKM